MRGGRPVRGSGRTIKVRIIGCMLVELLVENYAVVDRLRVRFHPGLNLLTGETGSGKSIVVDAFGLLRGSPPVAMTLLCERAPLLGHITRPTGPSLGALAVADFGSGSG